MGTGPSEIAERVVQALEAGDEAVAALHTRVVGCVLIALGSSPGEHEDLARRLAVLFRSDLVASVESTVHRALVELGKRQG